MSSRITLVSCVWVGSVVLAASASAQPCDAQWLSGAIPSPNGTVYATAMWDRDGAGPLQPVLVAGGTFTLAGTVPVSNLAMWDGVHWADIGGGVSGTMHGGTTAVNALAVMPNDDLVVGGAFDSVGAGAGQIAAPCIARFSGASWARMQSGLPGISSTVLKLGVRPNGDLVALGGTFANDDNTTCGPLVKWNDSSQARWSDLPTSQPNFQAYRTFAVLGNGDIVAGGVAGSAVGSSAVWRWNDSQGLWTGLGGGVNGTDPRWQVLSILEAESGDIVVAGNFLTAGDISANSIARWNGSQWFAYGTGITYPSQLFKLAVRALAQMPNGDIVAGGDFDTAGGNVGGRLARWDGQSWARLPQGAGDIVWTLLRTPVDELIIGGAFTNAGGSFANKRIARYTDRPVPWVALNPASQSIAHDATATFLSSPATGFANVSFHWQRNGVDIVDGAAGASIGGGTVSGSSGTLSSPTNGASVTLTLLGARASDSGQYRAVFTNSCGSAASDAAMLSVSSPPCPADFDGDGFITFEDFDAFISSFEAGEARSDFNHDGFLDFSDFDSFVGAFEIGC